MDGCSLNKIPYTTDTAKPSAVGLIVLQTDESIENEFRVFFDGSAAALYHTRIPNSPYVNANTLAQMEKDIPQVSALLPDGLNAIAYACTSGATVIGEDKVQSAVQSVHPHTPVTNPLSAMLAACHVLNVRRLGFITPYIEEVSYAMRCRLEVKGLAITAFASFNTEEDRTVARISEQSVLDAIVGIASKEEADAVFVSCTNLRTFNIIAEAERRIAKPVLSSNQVLAWHLSRLAGIKTAKPQLGRLLY